MNNINIKQCLPAAIIITLSLLTAIPVSGQSEGTLIIFREDNYLGSSLSTPLTINGETVAELENNSLFWRNLPAGTYELSVRTHTSATIEVTIMPGDTCFVKSEVKPIAGISGIPSLEEVDNASARKLITPEMTDISFAGYTKDVRRYSLGAVSFLSTGFNNVLLFERDYGKPGTISTGGGFSIGIQFTHRIAERLEMSYDILYQKSTLSVNMENATALFDRVFSSASIWYLTPVKNSIITFKAGGGPALIMINRLTIDGSQVGQSLTQATYKTAPALRAGGIIEAQHRALGLTLGGNFIFAGHRLKSVKVDHIPGDMTYDDLIKPNSSSFNITLGLHLYF